MKVITENKVSENKQVILDKLMSRIGTFYIGESMVHKEVKNGLAKMSIQNLSRLSLMIQTSK